MAPRRRGACGRGRLVECLDLREGGLPGATAAANAGSTLLRHVDEAGRLQPLVHIPPVATQVLHRSTRVSIGSKKRIAFTRGVRDGVSYMFANVCFERDVMLGGRLGWQRSFLPISGCKEEDFVESW